MQEWFLQKGDSAWIDSAHRARTEKTEASPQYPTSTPKTVIDKGAPCLTPTLATASPRSPRL
jgi:hypothetical protein